VSSGNQRPASRTKLVSWRSTRVIVPNTHADNASILSAIQAGARPPDKHSGSDQLRRAIETVAGGEALLEPAFQARLLEAVAEGRAGYGHLLDLGTGAVAGNSARTCSYGWICHRSAVVEGPLSDQLNGLERLVAHRSLARHLVDVAVSEGLQIADHVNGTEAAERVCRPETDLCLPIA
jgi:hypothetical protein